MPDPLIPSNQKLNHPHSARTVNHIPRARLALVLKRKNESQTQVTHFSESNIASLVDLATTLASRQSAEILLMLREAPGYAGDIANALDLSIVDICEALEKLSATGLVEHVRDNGDWYRLSGPLVAVAIDALIDVHQSTSELA